MEEKQIKTKEFNGKDGKVYHSINLKPKEGEDSLQPNQYCVLEKVFAEGIEKEGKYGKYYICRVKYNDKDCSLLLSAKEHDNFKVVGEAGSKIKAILEEVRVEFYIGAEKKTKQVRLVNSLRFELA
jgi:hypothetical protein